MFYEIKHGYVGHNFNANIRQGLDLRILSSELIKKGNFLAFNISNKYLKEFIVFEGFRVIEYTEGSNSIDSFVKEGFNFTDFTTLETNEEISLIATGSSKKYNETIIDEILKQTSGIYSINPETKQKKTILEALEMKFKIYGPVEDYQRKLLEIKSIYFNDLKLSKLMTEKD